MYIHGINSSLAEILPLLLYVVLILIVNAFLTNALRRQDRQLSAEVSALTSSLIEEQEQEILKSTK